MAKKFKVKKSKVDYSSPYEGAMGKSSDRETAKKKWMSKATKDEVDLGMKLTRDTDGDFIARTKLSSPSNYEKGGKFKILKKGGKTKSRVNEAGNYTKPGMRKRLFNKIKAGSKGGKPGQWSARKAQMLAQQYKAAGGGYRD